LRMIHQILMVLLMMEWLMTIFHFFRQTLRNIGLFSNKLPYFYDLFSNSLFHRFTKTSKIHCQFSIIILPLCPKILLHFGSIVVSPYLEVSCHY
jgi:hypothetical protein